MFFVLVGTYRSALFIFLTASSLSDLHISRDYAEGQLYSSDGELINGAKWRGVDSWNTAIQLWRENHARAGPHTCHFTFTSEPSGFTGRGLIPSNATPAIAQPAPPYTQPAPSTPHTPQSTRNVPHSPITPRGRGQGRAMRIPPELAATFAPTPPTPSSSPSPSKKKTKSTATRYSSVSPSPSSSSSSSLSRERGQPSSNTFEWYMVFSSASEGPLTFDNM